MNFVKFTQNNDNSVFSIIIPTWNNLDYLKLCVESIRKNSSFNHQIILHINEGIDGTKEWAEKEKIDYTHSTENVGICIGVNAAAQLALADYIVYMNDDMYVCQNWDKYLFEEIEQQKDDLFFFSSTLIEPKFTKNSCVLAPFNFGNNPQDFEEEKLLEYCKTNNSKDWYGATWPPNIISRKNWNLVGGFSIEFSPGMYSDPDFSMKLWQLGIRNFKGVGKSLVYHFMSKSTSKLKKNKNRKGRKIFLDKWEITPKVFYKYYLKMGELYNGILNEPKIDFKLKTLLLFCKLKKILK
jgi:GT2 family glycosyltransferase